jgi:transposase-like protein
MSASHLTMPPPRIPPPPDPEVRPVAERRAWTAAEKLRILRAAEACRPGSPERGALLRREGSYSSPLSQWRRQRERGMRDGLAAQPRGPKPAPPDPLAGEVARLRRENTRLQARLAQAEAIIAIQKNVAQLLGMPPAAGDER